MIIFSPSFEKKPGRPAPRTRRQRRAIERLAQKLGFDPNEDLEPRYITKPEEGAGG